MPAESTIHIVPSELAQIVESVFENMIGLEARRCGEPWFSGEDRLTAAVHLAGPWNGAVLVECNRRQACEFTARFLSIDAPGSIDDVVRDMLGELANMIGGNLKCVLGQGIHVSMPTVVEGSDYSPRVCGAERVCTAELDARLAFECSEGVFWVTILVLRS